MWLKALTSSRKMFQQVTRGKDDGTADVKDGEGAGPTWLKGALNLKTLLYITRAHSWNPYTPERWNMILSAIRAVIPFRIPFGDSIMLEHGLRTSSDGVPFSNPSGGMRRMMLQFMGSPEKDVPTFWSLLFTLRSVTRRVPVYFWTLSPKPWIFILPQRSKKVTPGLKVYEDGCHHQEVTILVRWKLHSTSMFYNLQCNIQTSH